MELEICQWFALCANETSQGLMHPVLGLTPCCTRCARLAEQEAQLEPLVLIDA